jgi:hypothetical protein
MQNLQQLSFPVTEVWSQFQEVKMAAAKPKSISKSDILKALCDSTQLSKKQVISVLDGLAALVAKNVGKKGPGVIALPGLVKIKVVNKPATPARKGVMVLGQLRDIAAKPASKKVRVLPLKALKDMVK